MKNSDYWKQRFTVLENASHSYGQKTYSQIESAFTQAQRDIQGEIDKWYGRFAKNNGVTLADAKKLLSSKDLAELKWDVNQYIQYGRQNALNKQWMKELENASAKFHITRLEALQLRTQQAMEVAFGNQLDSVDKMARHIITENYYHSIFEVQRGFNIGWNIGQMNERVLDKLVVKPWAADGKNFSDRIWQQKQNMVGQLHRELTRTLIQGKSPDAAIKHLEQFVDSEFKNARYAAKRLVMTETAYFHSVSQKEAYKELDVEEFEILATIDSKTSKVCQEMDGKRFPMKDYEAGVTAPPFHPNCRSTTLPYDKDFDNIGERAARDKDGKTYYIPANMSYADWKKEYVECEGLTNPNKGGIIQETRSPILSLDDTVSKAKEFAESSDYENAHSYMKIRAITNAKLGYDGLPNVVGEEEFNRISKGKNILYRGVVDAKEKTAAEIVDEFKFGALWTGNSGGAVYGNGVYFSPEVSVAEFYSGNNGALIEGILSDDARVVDYLEILQEFSKTGIPRIIGDPKEDYQFIIRDVGQYAAVKGYDAIAANGFNGNNHIVVLNRSKMIVKG